jgi:hypothetical protein
MGNDNGEKTVLEQHLRTSEGGVNREVRKTLEIIPGCKNLIDTFAAWKGFYMLHFYNIYRGRSFRTILDIKTYLFAFLK